MAGPFTTEPSSIEKALPWHSHMMSPSETELTMQPWWVQTAVKHLKSPWFGWVTTICSLGEDRAAADLDVGGRGEGVLAAGGVLAGSLAGRSRWGSRWASPSTPRRSGCCWGCWGRWPRSRCRRRCRRRAPGGRARASPGRRACCGGSRWGWGRAVMAATVRIERWPTTLSRGTRTRLTGDPQRSPQADLRAAFLAAGAFLAAALRAGAFVAAALVAGALRARLAAFGCFASRPSSSGLRKWPV